MKPFQRKFYHLFIFILSLLCTDIYANDVQITKFLLQNHTLNYLIPFETYYVDESSKTSGVEYKFSTKTINKYMTSSKLIIDKYQHLFTNTVTLSDYIQVRSYPSKDWLYILLTKNHSYYATTYITNRRIGVIGSLTPWIESVSLLYYPTHIDIFEYQKLSITHPLITVIPSHRFSQYYHSSSIYTNTYTLLYALRCLDHDGLGRYGDPWNAYADFHMMKVLYNLLQPGGILILSISIGADVVVYNLLRRYGRIRLSMLFHAANFTIIDVIGWDFHKLDEKSSYLHTYEPIFVLQKPPNSISLLYDTSISEDNDDYYSQYDPSTMSIYDFPLLINTADSLQQEEL